MRWVWRSVALVFVAVAGSAPGTEVSICVKDWKKDLAAAQQFPFTGAAKNDNGMWCNMWTRRREIPLLLQRNPSNMQANFNDTPVDDAEVLRRIKAMGA